MVLAEGGFYADVDTSCEKPFDELVRPEDQLIVGWEGEWISAEETKRVAFTRQRQVRPGDMSLCSCCRPHFPRFRAHR